MELVVGVLVAVAIAVAGRFSGMDLDRAVFPVILVVIASYYVLFSIMHGSDQAVLIELAIASLFVAVAFVGFRKSLWIVVVALAAHGAFDCAHPHLLADSGVPPWWSGFCFGVDVVLAACLGWLIVSDRLSAQITRRTGAAR